MRRIYLFVILLFCVNLNIFANSIIQIEISDYKKYTNEELRWRIWNLERAVVQLQDQVFKLSSNPYPAPPLETWVCNIKGLHGTYSEVGASRAIAWSKVIKACKAAEDGFFCKNPDCSQ